VPVYSEVTDLLLGDIPLPSYLDPASFVSDATDEIDSRIGFIYKTPIDISDSSALVRPARLLLKRVCNFLASGRLLLAISTPTEDAQANAYGLYLIQEATTALGKIENGSIELTGAELANSESASRGPMQYNEDEVSAVDTFYSGLTSPLGIINPARGRTSYVPRAGG
jgi:hypothetical protein